MKHFSKQKLLSGTLAPVLCFALCTSTVSAHETRTNGKYNFHDVDSSNWAYEYLITAYESGIVKGDTTENGTTITGSMYPNAEVTGNELMVMIANSMNQSRLALVQEGIANWGDLSGYTTTEWARPFIYTVAGYGENGLPTIDHINLDASLTRLEVAEIITMALDGIGLSTGEGDTSLGNSVAVRTMTQYALMVGTDGDFMGDKAVTRAEASVIILKLREISGITVDKVDIKTRITPMTVTGLNVNLTLSFTPDVANSSPTTDSSNSSSTTPSTNWIFTSSNSTATSTGPSSNGSSSNTPSYNIISTSNNGSTSDTTTTTPSTDSSSSNGSTSGTTTSTPSTDSSSSNGSTSGTTTSTPSTGSSSNGSTSGTTTSTPVSGSYDTSKYSVPADTNKDGVVTEAEVRAKMAELEKLYPTTAPNGVGGLTRKSYNGSSYEHLYYYEAQLRVQAYGCAAWAYFVNAQIFGNLPLRETTEYTIGDILKSDFHTTVVYDIRENNNLFTGTSMAVYVTDASMGMEKVFWNETLDGVIGVEQSMKNGTLTVLTRYPA